ncbi:MAG: CCA tRNA nucleotidyltransferase [Planctomycetota bacterium]|nr:CCA tRNA nucleotidyltransferase [Planctomycetota bacterium]
MPEPSELELFSVRVVETLARAGHRALFAGGCVRDRLRGVTPKDYDVATSATPDDVIKLFPHTAPVGAAFGVVRVIGPRPAEDAEPLQVEVATFRTESGYSDGRHPDRVAFAGEVEDVKRRDFTVNGLLYDPLKDEVVDYVGGREDLARKLVRAIGDPRARFHEDRLRMLRAVRFAAALGFAIDGPTLGAIKQEASAIHAVSAERIRDELNKMLTGPRPREAMVLLKETRLMKEILPEVDALAGVEQPPEFHPEGDVWVHTLLLLEPLEEAPLTLALGALLHDIGKPPTFMVTDRIRFNEHDKVGARMTEELMRRLKYPNETIERVVDLVHSHMMFKDAKKMRRSTLKRFLRKDHFDEHLALHRLDCMACHGKLESYEFCREQLGTLGGRDLRPAPLIDGEDLKALGLTPGPRFRAILADIEDRQLEGALTTREEALAYVKSMESSQAQAGPRSGGGAAAGRADQDASS